MSRSLPVLIALVVASACRTGEAPSAADVASYDRATSDLAAEVEAYRGATSAMSSIADCLSALDLHLSRVRPDVATLTPLAGRIGEQMMGAMDDMPCGMGLISREVDLHAAAACASADLEQDRAEAQQYCDAMEEYVEHMQMRGAQAGAMMGSGSGMMGGGMMGGGMMDWDGGGFPMPDGGMMPWDHRLPGCGADDGG